MGAGLMAAEPPTEEMQHLAVGEGGEDEESGEELHTGEPGGASQCLSALAVRQLASGRLYLTTPNSNRSAVAARSKRTSPGAAWSYCMA